jgi:DNA-binding MarR family transcriptional regulator
MKEFPKAAHIALDENGRLYDRNARAYLSAFIGEETARRLEPIAAIRWLMKELHHQSGPLAERHGLSEGRVQLLMRLKHGGDCPLGELAEQLHVTARNVTGLMDHLERDGLVERVPDPNDRRSVRAHLTGQGEELIEQLWRESLTAGLRITEGIPQEELDQLRHTCIRIVQTIESERDDASTSPHHHGASALNGEGTARSTT